MPFDDTRPATGAPSEFHIVSPQTPAFSISSDGVEVEQRRAIIQRTVTAAAGILFGALGALAGAAVVVLMLVALVIPTTTVIIASTFSAVLAAGAIVVWLRRRAIASSNEERPPEFALTA